MASNQIEIDRVETLKVLEDKLKKWEIENAIYEQSVEAYETARKQYELDTQAWELKAREYVLRNGQSENVIERSYRNTSVHISLFCSTRDVEMVIGKMPELTAQYVNKPDFLRTDKDYVTNLDRLRNTVQMLKLSAQATISGSLARNAFSML